MGFKFFSFFLIILQLLNQVLSYEANCNCFQETVVDPHCASDGVAYPTLCHFQCAQKGNPQLRFVSKGVCPEADRRCTDLNCPFDETVCATDGWEYMGNCTITCLRRTYPQLKFAHNGKCQRGPDPTEIICTCPLVPVSPVCGTSQYTYAGICGFECAQKINPDLKLWLNERCPMNPGPLPPDLMP